MDDGEEGVSLIAKEEHMHKNIITFSSPLPSTKAFYLRVVVVFFCPAEPLLLQLWRGLIRNGPPVCPKHIQPAHECMQMHFLGGVVFMC